MSAEQNQDPKAPKNDLVKVDAPAFSSEDVAMAALQNELRTQTFKSAFESAAAFAHFQRVGTMFSASSFVPAHFQGPQKVGDCVIAVELARDLRVSPLTLMQKTFVVKGTPGFKTDFLIGLANQRKVFASKIRWREEQLDPAELEAETQVNWPTGKKREKGTFRNIRMVAWAKDPEDPDGEPLEAYVDTEMAIGEDWISNSKYWTMFVHMMRWRAAAFLLRLYAPEILMGFHTVEELDTMPAHAHVEPFRLKVGPGAGEIEIDPAGLPQAPAATKPAGEPRDADEESKITAPFGGVPNGTYSGEGATVDVDEGPPADGPPWKTIGKSALQDLRKRLKALKLTDADLLEALGKEDLGSPENLPAEDYDQADAVLLKQEKKGANGDLFSGKK